MSAHRPEKIAEFFLCLVVKIVFAVQLLGCGASFCVLKLVIVTLPDDSSRLSRRLEVDVSLRYSISCSCSIVCSGDAHCSIFEWCRGYCNAS